MRLTFGDIKKADAEERELQKEKRNKELLQQLCKQLENPEIKFSDVDIDFEKYEDAGYVTLSFELKDGFKQEDDLRWRWDESVEDVASKITKYILYIQQLRTTYPDYAVQNDYIQSHRRFFRKCKSSHSNCEEFYVKAELCGMLKLPNTTDCSCGGGDYEIKRTPKRVKDFKNNIDNICLFMSDCIAELRQMKREIEEIESRRNAPGENRQSEKAD